MQDNIKKNPRSESLRVEYDHYQHDENGVPVFWDSEEHKVIHKIVGYFAQECPECGAIMHDVRNSRPSCGEACGGFYDQDVLSFEELKSKRSGGSQ